MIYIYFHYANIHSYMYVYIYIYIHIEHTLQGTITYREKENAAYNSKASLRVLGGVLGVGNTWPWSILSVACIADQLGQPVMLRFAKS